MIVRLACDGVEAAEHTVVGQPGEFVAVGYGRDELFVGVVAVDSARPE